MSKGSAGPLSSPSRIAVRSAASFSSLLRLMASGSNSLTISYPLATHTRFRIMVDQYHDQRGAGAPLPITAALNGLTTVNLSSMTRPSCMSSLWSVSQPASNAALTINESQCESW